MTETRYSFTRVSGNRKTGPIPVTSSARSTCPPSCALYDAGCYALHGPVGWQWGRLTDKPERAARGLTFAGMLEAIRKLPGRTLWRHNVAGDLPGDGDKLDRAALSALARANRGRRGFTFTHKPPTKQNIAAMHAATHRGFTINLSADNRAHADELAVHGLPVVVVIPTAAPKVSRTPGGRKIVQCPAENSDRVTCANCQLCALPSRDYLIGFKPHGIQKRRVEAIATGETNQ